MALQQECEAYLAEYFQDFNPAAMHAGRVTIKYKDFAFVRSIQHESIIFNPSTSEGADLAHGKQVKNRNTYREG
jgi:hypothetical protein